MNAYWALLAEGKKIRASEYVDSALRDKFLTRPFPSFSKPRLKSLEPGPSGTQVGVTVEVKRLLPPLYSEVDYPVWNSWVFKRGEWYVVVETEQFLTFSAHQKPSGQMLSPEEEGKRKAAVREALKFSQDKFDFGTVRQGTPVSFSVAYDLQADHAYEAYIRSGPREIRGLADYRLAPGAGNKIEFTFPTGDYDGQIDEPLTVAVREQGVEVLYEWKLYFRVYTPLSIMPRVSRFQSGEKEKKIEIRNNSPQRATIPSIFADDFAVSVTPLPQTLGPGEKCELTVRLLGDRGGQNRPARFWLKLAEPVEEMRSILVSVITNYVPQTQSNPVDLSPRQIEELIKNNRPGPIKP